MLSFPGALSAEELDKEISELTDQVVRAVDQADVKTIAILDFVDLQGRGSQLGRFVADEISTDLVMAKKRFTVVDRANLKKIMQENKLTISGLVDPDNAKKLGQIAGVDAIVTGTLTPFDKSVRVAIKVIATDTAKIIAAARGQITKTPAVEKLAGGGIDSEGEERSVNESGENAVSASTPTNQVFNLGDVTASVEWAKLSRGQLEVSLAFTNKGKRPLWILPASDRRDNAQATDDVRNSYRWTGANGFRRLSGTLNSNTNTFLRLDPGVPALASLEFRKSRSDADERAPTKIRFSAGFTIIEDIKTFVSHNRTVSATVKLN
jgi:curli biogenesis system outer membrane secretion channel CsgG